MGYRPGYNITTGTTNTIIVSTAMHEANVTAVALGFGAGYWETEVKLYMIISRDLSQEGKSLIYSSGVSSDNQYLTINGNLIVKHDATVDKLTLEADIRILFLIYSTEVNIARGLIFMLVVVACKGLVMLPIH